MRFLKLNQQFNFVRLSLPAPENVPVREGPSAFKESFQFQFLFLMGYSIFLSPVTHFFPPVDGSVFLS